MNYTKTVWKDLPDISTPITASRLNNIEDGVEYLFENESKQGINEYSESTNDSYSCNYVNNVIKDVYSTTETVIGTWLGKPIYRKVIQYNKTSNGQVDLSLSTYGITNVENIWLNQNSFIKTNDNEWKAVNTYESESYFTFCTFRSSSSFRLSSNSSYAKGVWNLIIEYTKTTD